MSRANQHFLSGAIRSALIVTAIAGLVGGCKVAPSDSKMASTDNVSADGLLNLACTWNVTLYNVFYGRTLSSPLSKVYYLGDQSSTSLKFLLPSSRSQIESAGGLDNYLKSLNASLGGTIDVAGKFYHFVHMSDVQTEQTMTYYLDGSKLSNPSSSGAISLNCILDIHAFSGLDHRSVSKDGLTADQFTALPNSPTRAECTWFVNNQFYCVDLSSPVSCTESN